MSYPKSSCSKTNKNHQNAQTNKQKLDLYNSLLKNNTHHLTITQFNSSLVHSQYIIRLPPCVNSIILGHSLLCFYDAYEHIMVPHTVSHVSIEEGCPVPFLFHNKITHIRINTYYQHKLNFTNKLKYLIIGINARISERKIMLYNGLTHLIVKNQLNTELNFPKTLRTLDIREFYLHTNYLIIPKSVRYILLHFSHASFSGHILFPSKVKRMSINNRFHTKYNIPKYLSHLYISTYNRDKVLIPESPVYVCLHGCDWMTYDNVPNSVINYEFSGSNVVLYSNYFKNIPNSVKYITIYDVLHQHIKISEQIIGSLVGLKNIFHRYDRINSCEILYGDKTNYECTGKLTIIDIFTNCGEVWNG